MGPSRPREVSPAPVTCVTQDPCIGVEGYKELPSVGDLHDVRVDATKNDVAKVQDVLRQLRSERRRDSPLTTAWAHFHVDGRGK